MRILLLHNRLYRAFPELDPYPDDRCRKFVRAAQRGWVRRILHVAVILLVSGLLLVGGLALSLWLLSLWNSGNGSGPDPLGPGLALILLFVCAAPVSGYLTRDRLLRRRVRYVLRTRGTCASCRYSLVGLPVSAEHTVRCPECALETEVDPSLGELVLDESGMGRFQPSERALPRPPRIFTPPRVRVLKKVGVVAAIVVGVGAPALLGGYELWLRHQAATARGERPGVEALLALVEANQPPGSEGGANAWDVLQEAINLLGQAESADQAPNPEPAGDEVYAEFSYTYDGIPKDGSLEDIHRYVTSDQKARRLLKVYRSHGVYEVMDRMARAPRAVPALLVPPGEPLINLQEPYLGKLRQLARINAARMELASEGGDLQEYISALEPTLALARVAMYGPLLIDRLVGTADEMLAYNRLNSLLAKHPSTEWLDAIDAAIARQRVTLPSNYVWEGERLYELDAIAWVFSDPERVRWGRLSSEVETLIQAGSEGSVGGYAANRDALNAFFREVEDRAVLPRWSRTSLTNTPDQSPLRLIRAIAAGGGSALRSFDQMELIRLGYTIEAALERYRAAHGEYPTRLTPLVPEYLSRLPVDPWTGKPWGYRLRVAGQLTPDDPRGFVLYSFGTDGHDDGGQRGKASSGGNFSALRNNAPGTDFIINDWQPPEH